MNKIYTTRKIEEACKRDINFMWLIQYHNAPDHNTIARFRTGRLSEFLLLCFGFNIDKLHNKIQNDNCIAVICYIKKKLLKSYN